MGGGKTQALLLKLLLNAMASPGGYFVVGRWDFPKLQDTVIRMWIECIIPADWSGQGLYNANMHTFRIPYTGDPGSRIAFRNLSDEKGLMGPEWSGFALDQAEEIPRDRWEFAATRIRDPRSPCQRLLTANAMGHNWVWREFYQNADKDHESFTMKDEKANAGNLDSDYYSRLRSTLPDHMYRRLVLSDFDAAASGLVFDELGLEHMIRSDWEPTHDWTVYAGMDTGYRNPTAVVFAAVKWPHVVIFDEYRRIEKTPYEIARDIGPLMDRWKVKAVFVDPSTRLEEKAVYLRYKIPIVNAYSRDKKARIMEAKTWLRPMSGRPAIRDVLEGVSPLPSGDAGPGVYFVPSRCPELMSEMRSSVWRVLSERRAMQIDDPEEPPDRDNHSTDAWLYVQNALTKIHSGDFIAMAKGVLPRKRSDKPEGFPPMVVREGENKESRVRHIES